MSGNKKGGKQDTGLTTIVLLTAIFSFLKLKYLDNGQGKRYPLREGAEAPFPYSVRRLMISTSARTR